MITGYIYAITAGNYVKIGWSADPEKRLVQLQHASPLKCVLAALMEGDKADEAEIHRSLSEHRCRGEWYFASPAVEAFVRAMPLRYREPKRYTSGNAIPRQDRSARFFPAGLAVQ
jgi:Meiotically Up-regulated Gene 113 (MUG113) protein